MTLSGYRVGFFFSNPYLCEWALPGWSPKSPFLRELALGREPLFLQMFEHVLLRVKSVLVRLSNHVTDNANVTQGRGLNLTLAKGTGIHFRKVFKQGQRGICKET